MNKFKELDALTKRVKQLEHITPQSSAPGYKVYAALLNQSGVDAPVATVLADTLNGTWTYERNNTGDYSLYDNGDGVFTAEKTLVFFNGGNIPGGLYNYHYMGASQIKLYTTDVDGSKYDDYLVNASIEIRVYS